MKRLLTRICGFICDMEEQNKLKIQGFLLVVFGLLFQSRIQSRYSRKVAKSFLQFRFITPSSPTNSCEEPKYSFPFIMKFDPANTYSKKGMVL